MTAPKIYRELLVRYNPLGDCQQMIEAANSYLVRGLAAVGPAPEMRDKLMLFGQFVGDWDIVEARFPQPDGTEVKKSGEVHFGWILDGRAIQDVWMTHVGTPSRATTVGTTIRFYDPKIDAWHVIWIAPGRGAIQIFVARLVGEEIVLEGQSEDGYPERWIFSEVTTNSFRWRAVESHDNQSTWELTEEMHIQRKPANGDSLQSP